MKRGQNYNDNITKLYTFVNMKKSLNYLKIYIEKITNKRCQSLKFIEDFEPNVHYEDESPINMNWLINMIEEQESSATYEYVEFDDEEVELILGQQIE